MRLINNKFLLSDDICKKIISEYKDKVVLAKTDIRQQKIYHELNENSWLWNEIQKLISSNLGDSYSVYSRVTILKYTKGDYFLEHKDDVDKTGSDPRFFTVTIQLTPSDKYIGGDVVVDRKNIIDKKIGSAALWGSNIIHEVKNIQEGSRNSLVFFISSKHITLKTKTLI